jgi:hypothetical protein
MRIQSRFGLVVLMTLSSSSASSASRQADFAKIAEQLQGYAGELRGVGRSMQIHARAAMPGGLDKSQEARLAAERRELEVTAEAALRLAGEIGNRERKARGGALTRADMETLGMPARALLERINPKSPGMSMPGTPARAGLSATVQDLDATRESVRNQRQTTSTAFQNHDQKAIQLYNALSSVMKTFNEMRMGVIRTLL